MGGKTVMKLRSTKLYQSPIAPKMLELLLDITFLIDLSQHALLKRLKDHIDKVPKSTTRYQKVPKGTTRQGTIRVPQRSFKIISILTTLRVILAGCAESRTMHADSCPSTAVVVSFTRLTHLHRCVLVRTAFTGN